MLHRVTATLKRVAATLEQATAMLHRVTATLKQVAATLQQVTATLNQVAAMLHQVTPMFDQATATHYSDLHGSSGTRRRPEYGVASQAGAAKGGTASTRTNADTARTTADARDRGAAKAVLRTSPGEPLCLPPRDATTKASQGRRQRNTRHVARHPEGCRRRSPVCVSPCGSCVSPRGRCGGGLPVNVHTQLDSRSSKFREEPIIRKAGTQTCPTGDLADRRFRRFNRY